MVGLTLGWVGLGCTLKASGCVYSIVDGAVHDEPPQFSGLAWEAVVGSASIGKEVLTGILMHHLDKAGVTDHWVAPRLPKKQLANAMSSFALLEPDETPLALVDGSRWIVGTKGVVFTDRGIHFDDDDERPHYFSYGDLKEVEYLGLLGFGEVLIRSRTGEEYRLNGGYNHDVRKSLIAALQHVINWIADPPSHGSGLKRYQRLPVPTVVMELGLAAPDLGDALHLLQNGVWTGVMPPTWRDLKNNLDPTEEMAGFIHGLHEGAEYEGLLFTDDGIHYQTNVGIRDHKACFVRYIDVAAGEVVESIVGVFSVTGRKDLRINGNRALAFSLSRGERKAVMRLIDRLAERSRRLNPHMMT